jgi:hypothetical protein
VEKELILSGFELIEGHKLERIDPETGRVMWRLSWKEKSDGTHYDEKEEFLEEE